ncbi:ABC transporter permease [Flexilinea flocculi]|jgi:ribose/xylose/arabinose/galactoside ABC-type transport system permease subunit|uniref:Ribose/xylose/arabinose/galactoside ABC-type transport system, permease component n=1 Tax=Flexilinea flocculi TaxID=1678840 RepID=A0A0S7BUA1_9CHLR|nr:ABC transporter permease [Flexilinea flocculi]GAP40480.1 ribose/xylose/arabinose/galactoside ABC-type transport system, permease component [Flexilinea flocculi]
MEKSQEKKILGMNQHDFSLFMKRYGIVFVMIGMFVILSVSSTKFLKMNNILNVLSTVALNGILAMGMVFVITAGGIDLSIGSLLALASTTIGIVLQATGSIPLACVTAVVICTFFGLLNGLLVAKFNMFPFVVTLASQLVIRGLGYVISGGYSFALANPKFSQIGLGKLFGIIPYPILILLGIAVISYLLLHWTKFGRYIYAVGGNINAATASGVNVFWTRVGSFIISGLFAGVAGIIMTARINAAQPNIGVGYETDAIAACVIGGTSFAGGISTIPGTMVGIIIIGLIYNGMNLIGISSYWQTISKGLLIIGAVMLDSFINKKR